MRLIAWEHFIDPAVLRSLRTWSMKTKQSPMFPRRWFSGLWWTSYTSIGWTSHHIELSESGPPFPENLLHFQCHLILSWHHKPPGAAVCTQGVGECVCACVCVWVCVRVWVGVCGYEGLLKVFYTKQNFSLPLNFLMPDTRTHTHTQTLLT